MNTETTLPKDPVMLLSIINMKLRDQFTELDQLCEYYNVSREHLTKRISLVGYSYDQNLNQFR